MLNLTTTASVVQLIAGSAGTINSSYSYVDVNQTATTASGMSGAANTVISTATTATVVPAPAATTTRNVTGLTVTNDSTTVNNAITINQYDGTNTVRLWKGTLGFGERVVLDAAGYWTQYGTDGLAKVTSVSFGMILAATGMDAAAVPDTSTLRWVSGTVASRMVPGFVSTDGVTRRFQERMSSSGWSAYFPNTSSTQGLNLGLGWTSGGTVSHPTPAAGMYNQHKRTRWANVVTTTNQVLGIKTGSAEKRYWRGNAAGQGGFQFHARFAIGLWPAATVRLFVGLNDSTSGYVISDTLTGHGCGLWHATTDAASVLSFVVVNAGTPTLSAITLGSNLAAGQMYDFEMSADPNSSIIGYKLTDLLTGTVLVDSTVTGATLPGNSSMLGQELAMSNGTANTTVTTTAFELAAHECHSNI